MTIKSCLLLAVFFMIGCTKSTVDNGKYFTYQNMLSGAVALAFSKDGKSIQLNDLEYEIINCSEPDFYCITVENDDFVLIVPNRLGKFCKLNACGTITDFGERRILGKSYNVAKVTVVREEAVLNYYLAEGVGIIGVSATANNGGGTIFLNSEKGFLSEFNFDKIKRKN